MITREEFEAKIKGFGYNEEQVTLCLAYYDNDSNSTSKPNVIDTYDSEQLIKTVKRWNGIKNSCKPKSSNKQYNKHKAEIEKLVDKLDEVIESTSSITLLSEIRTKLAVSASKAKRKEEEINNAKLEKYNQALALLNEYNKATGKNYKIVLE